MDHLDHLRHHGSTRQQEGNKGHDPFEQDTKATNIDPSKNIFGNF